jgi:hypothetical protein
VQSRRGETREEETLERRKERWKEGRENATKEEWTKEKRTGGRRGTKGMEEGGRKEKECKKDGRLKLGEELVRHPGLASVPAGRKERERKTEKEVTDANTLPTIVTVMLRMCEQRGGTQQGRWRRRQQS